MCSQNRNMAADNDISKVAIYSCFMHFDGVNEQLYKVTRQRLTKFLECRSKWAKLKCTQAEVARKSYEDFDESALNSYLERNTESIDLKWYYHKKCYKKFCDEEKIRRQQTKEVNSPGTSTDTIPAAAEPLLEPDLLGEPTQKFTRRSIAEPNMTLPQRNKPILPERCIICGRDSSWFSRDKV